MRILVIEDEKDLNNIIVKQLKKNKYAVDTCFNGNEALEYVLCAKYDVIISDVMMPRLDGFEFIKKIRKMDIHTPVIFLTARDSIEDKIKGLDLGANDYVVKPFSFEELNARIRVITRQRVENKSNILKVLDLTLDINSHIVTRGDKKIELSAKEYAVLEYMMINQGVVLSREKIENHIWNFDYEGGTNLIDVYIRYLRKKIDENYEEKLIKTVRGTGYVIR